MSPEVLLPRRVVLNVGAHGAPCGGFWVRLVLPTVRKNSFKMLAGPSRSDGVIIVSREWILEQVEMDRNMFPMDFTGIGDWTGEVLAQLLAPDAAARVVQAASDWPGLGCLDPSALQSLERLARVPLVVAAREGRTLEVVEPAGLVRIVE